MSVVAEPAAPRVAVITGASRGIGAATARTLAARGMRVVVNYRASDAEAEAVVDSVHAAGGTATAIAADVSSPDGCQRLVDQVVAHWGVVDVLVHNALMPFPRKPVTEITWPELSAAVQAELGAAVTLTHAVLPGMRARRWGRLVYLATNLARHPRETMVALGTAKAAVVQFARYVAQEVAPEGVTANIVAPSTVDTQTAADLPAQVREQVIARTPLGRLATPEDVAGMIAFFAGDDSSFLTGTYAPVTGGLAMD